MSYRLKKYGKSAYSYINALEEQVNKMGTTIDEVIRKEHFDMALKKVSMANSITSIKELLRMDFMQIFQNINGVEEVLKKDPANVYSKMDYKTKEYYRNKIKEISTKTKISEIYIARKCLELCSREGLNEKQKHVGYYLIDNGEDELLNNITGSNKKKISKNKKAKIYVSTIWGISILIDLVLTILMHNICRGRYSRRPDNNHYNCTIFRNSTNSYSRNSSKNSTIYIRKNSKTQINTEIRF